jgi:hypothetical protein|tara:strand:- start:40 stop:372 length:333 start_codon:yes stop_codon:yes gene_type:complete
MIDTDKYEGHTKGDNEVGWRITNNFVSNGKCPNDRYIAYVQAFSVVDFDLEDKVIEFSDADANLIADAPLLLEEVKRLRDLIEQVVDVWENCNHEDRNDWFNNFCEVMKE